MFLIGKDYLEELNDVAIQFLKSFGVDVGVKTDQRKEKNDSEAPKSTKPSANTSLTSEANEASTSESKSSLLIHFTFHTINFLF